jgi:hypothetical protein
MCILCSFDMWLSPTPDSDCGIWIWGIGLFLCELRIIILINMYTVCTMLHLEFELNESVNVLIMINIWFVFVIHVYAKFCSKLWVRDKIVQMLCISIIWIINTAFMLVFFSLSLLNRYYAKTYITSQQTITLWINHKL